MHVLQLPDRPGSDRPTTTWAASLLTALARDEAADRKPARLTEARLATWSRFRGRLDAADFVALLFDDAAGLHPAPFEPSRTGGPLRIDRLAEADADAWLNAIAALDLTAPPSRLHRRPGAPPRTPHPHRPVRPPRG